MPFNIFVQKTTAKDTAIFVEGQCGGSAESAMSAEGRGWWPLCWAHGHTFIRPAHSPHQTLPVDFWHLWTVSFFYSLMSSMTQRASWWLGGSWLVPPRTWWCKQDSLRAGTADCRAKEGLKMGVGVLKPHQSRAFYDSVISTRGWEEWQNPFIPNRGRKNLQFSPELWFSKPYLRRQMLCQTSLL